MSILIWLTTLGVPRSRRSSVNGWAAIWTDLGHALSLRSAFGCGFAAVRRQPDEINKVIILRQSRRLYGGWPLKAAGAPPGENDPSSDLVPRPPSPQGRRKEIPYPLSGERVSRRIGTGEGSCARSPFRSCQTFATRQSQGSANGLAGAFPAGFHTLGEIFFHSSAEICRSLLKGGARLGRAEHSPAATIGSFRRKPDPVLLSRRPANHASALYAPLLMVGTDPQRRTKSLSCCGNRSY